MQNSPVPDATDHSGSESQESLVPDGSAAPISPPSKEGTASEEGTPSMGHPIHRDPSIEDTPSIEDISAQAGLGVPAARGQA